MPFYTINPNVIRENEFLRFLNCKVPTMTLTEVKQEQVRSNPEGGSCKDGMKTTRSFQLGHPPNWTSPARRMAELVACSVQLRHLPSWSRFDPARPSTELDWFSSADGRASRVVDPARPSAELVAWSIQLCHPLSWTGSAWRMAELVVW